MTPEKDGRFDLVFSAYTLHHVPNLDDALHQIRSLLAPGGLVVLFDNVASTPAVPRWWFKREALKRFLADVARRQRPLREAVEVLRLQTHPAWLDHLTTDRFLSPSDFRHRYGSVFPGGKYTDLYRTCVLTWQAERD